MVIESLIITKLQVVWDLNHAQRGFLGSAVFVGFFIGAFVSGKLSDVYGRRPVFIVGAFTTAVFSFISAVSPNYYFLLVIRAFFGSGVGISIPACSSLAVEITPTKYRAWVMNLVWVFFPVGEIFSVIIASYMLNEENGWRWLLAVVSIPATISCILSLFINESPRFYLSTRQFDKAFINLDRILKYSTDRIELTPEMKNRIINEELGDEDAKVIKSNYSTLCKKDYVRLTVQTCAIYFICSFCYYGFTFILPQLMKEHHNKSMITQEESDKHMFSTLIFAALSEIPSVFVASFLSNIKCLGRVRTMGIGLILSCIASILCAIFLAEIKIFGSIFKFSVNIPYGVIYVYTCEAFPTQIRSIAVGVTGAFNRLGGIFTPIISQMVFSLNIVGPFITFAIASLGGVFLAFFLPFETLGRTMD